MPVHIGDKVSKHHGIIERGDDGRINPEIKIKSTNSWRDPGIVVD